MNMPQTHLAQKIGVTFQAVQKWESGVTRVSAASLWDIARVLECPITYFYEALENTPAQKQSTTEELKALRVVEPLTTVPAEVRDQFIELARKVAKAFASR